MEPRHKTIREMLRRLPVPEAYNLLVMNLPEREYRTIYYNDVEQRSLLEVADMLKCTESNIKRIRRSGYEKLTALFYPKN